VSLGGVLSTQDSDPRPEIDHPRMKPSPARNFQPAYGKACCVHGAVVNEPHKDQLAQTRLSHLSSTMTLPSLVGIYNPFQEIILLPVILQ
jgi:hypothetical protein